MAGTVAEPVRQRIAKIGPPVSSGMNVNGKNIEFAEGIRSLDWIVGRNGFACPHAGRAFCRIFLHLLLYHFERMRALRMLPSIDALELRGCGPQQRDLDASQQAIPLKKEVA